MKTNSLTRYSWPSIAFHWLLAVLLVALIGIGWYMVDLPKKTPAVAQFYTLHKSLGLIAAVLIAMRLLWRFRRPPPEYPVALSHWQRHLSTASHWLLYIGMVVMPVSGFTASNFQKFGIRFFGYPLPRLGWEDKVIYSFFNSIHVFTSSILAAVITIHVFAAIHHAAKRDGMFGRMLP